MAPVSTVLRERARKLELQQLRDKIKNQLPVLTKREIRRFRIPYHEALCLELNEDGYSEAAMFLRLLINFQEEMRKEAGCESLIWFYPQLINEKDKLDIMYNGLRDAEIGKLSGKFRIECEEILELGVYFSNQLVGWWWLAKQLLLQAVECAKEYRDDGGRTEAVCRYVLGRFYLNQLNEVENAIEELKLCREKAVGKPKWNASAELGMEQENLYVECCTLLYRALLIVAKFQLEEDAAKAARICQIAQNRAKDANDEKGISECLLQLGICELRTGNANTALIKFNKVLAMSLTAQSPERICEARIQIALAQSRLGNITEASFHLESLLEYAFSNKLHFYYGQAHRFLGELYLNQGEPHLSTPLLIKAVDIFSSISDLENIEQVKNLAAISAAQELLPMYVTLILSCENNIQKQTNIIKMVKWKDTREAFWDIFEDGADHLSTYCQNGRVGDMLHEDTTDILIDEETVDYEVMYSNLYGSSTGQNQTLTEETSFENIEEKENEEIEILDENAQENLD